MTVRLLYSVNVNRSWKKSCGGSCLSVRSGNGYVIGVTGEPSSMGTASGPFSVVAATEPVEAARANSGKPELAQLLLFAPALEALAAHCTAGRAKYADRPDGQPNWTLGGKPDSEYTDAAMRHLAAFVGGARYDRETGTQHLAAVLWNIATLITMNHDDLPTTYGENK